MKKRGLPGLEAMYVVATLLMGLAALFVVAMMFIPPDWFDRRDLSQAYVPGATAGWTPAVPRDQPGVREIAAGEYEAVIHAANWEFTPNEFRVPIGSRVTFKVRSIQDFHGMALVGTDIALSLLQNDIAEASYTFDDPGEYLFVCSDYCGSGHASMSGKVIVQSGGS